MRGLACLTEVSGYYCYVAHVDLAVSVEVGFRVPAWVSRVGAEGPCYYGHVFHVYFTVAVYVAPYLYLYVAVAAEVVG